MRIVTISILVLFLFGCGSKNNKKKAEIPKQVTQANTNSKDSIKIDDAFSPPINPDDTIPGISIPADAIQVTEDTADSTAKIYIIGNGGDIMNKPALSKLHWKKLTWKNYLSDTKIKLKREPYSEGTEEVGTVGLFMSSTGTDKGNRYLISGLNLPNGPVDTISIKRKRFYPGQKETFNYKGIAYTLYATGHKMDTLDKGYDNYKLFLTANIKGRTFNQLIVSMKSDFGDTDIAEVLSYCEINFIGDIDGDKIPDIVINTIGNFWGRDYLYLSSVAGDKAIVRPIAFSDNH